MKEKGKKEEMANLKVRIYKICDTYENHTVLSVPEECYSKNTVRRVGEGRQGRTKKNDKEMNRSWHSIARKKVLLVGFEIEISRDKEILSFLPRGIHLSL